MRQATLFANSLPQVLERADRGEMLWYNAHPDMRKGKTAAQVVGRSGLQAKREEDDGDEHGAACPDGQAAAAARFHKGTERQIRQIEAVGDEEGLGHGIEDIRTGALRDRRPHRAKTFPRNEEYTLAVLKARPKGRVYEWWVDERDVSATRPRRTFPRRRARWSRRRRAWALSLLARRARVRIDTTSRAVRFMFLTRTSRSNARFPRARPRRPGALPGRFARRISRAMFSAVGLQSITKTRSPRS